MEIPAKKSLGQNFLKSKEAIRDIIEAADLHTEDIILEVGPGKGVLTEALLEKAKKVIAVEKDDRMIDLLKEQFSLQIQEGKLILIHEDILEIQPEKIGLKNSEYKIVANIPYYITGQFLRTFLSGFIQPSRMVLMLQKEVAKRIVAQDKKESILSMSVKAFGQPKYINTVKAKYFSPEPKVDSAILLISAISRNIFSTNSNNKMGGDTEGIDEKSFFALVKKGFAHKRKMLAQNLEIPKEKRQHIFAAAHLSEKVRAEDISLSDWTVLVKMISDSELQSDKS